MDRWLIKRTVQVFVTIYLALSLSFVILRMMPGGPMDYLRAQAMTSMAESGGSADISTMNERIEYLVNINPDEPLYIQYIDYIAAILQGDLGQSILYNEPVQDIMARALPWTVFLSTVSLILTFSIGIILGAALAYREGTQFDIVGSSGSILLTSVPFYVLAIILLAALSFRAEIFPIGGRVGDAPPGLNPAFMISILYHAVLPLTALVVTRFGGLALSMRGNAIRIIGEDYLRVARLRGLPENLIVLRYVGRNAILPLYTSLMISIASIFGGSIILETLFTYPGMGWYMYKGFQARDYALLMGGFIITTIAVILGIYVADLTYGKIDPRVTAGEERETY